MPALERFHDVLTKLFKNSEIILNGTTFELVI
jgi:hypothetical protein